MKKTKRSKLQEIIKKLNLSQQQKKLLVIVSVLTILIFSFLIITAPGKVKFNPDFPVTQRPSEEIKNSEQSSNDVKLLMVGDVMTARSIGIYIQNGRDPFEYVKGKFDEYDAVLANLETNISDPNIGSPAVGKLFTFNAPVESIDTLKNAGISIVSLANNHTMDYGSEALADMLNRLDAKSILYAGAGRNINEAFQPKYILLNGVKIGLFAVNDIETWFASAGDGPGSAFFDDGRMRNALSEARQNCDVLIVFPHWGIEYDLQNSDRQQQYGHFFIDNGADIVVGGHSHVLQNIEDYNGKKIYYSMGNFLFDGFSTIENGSDGGMVEIIIQDKKLTDSSMIKVHLNADGLPQLN